MPRVLKKLSHVVNGSLIFQACTKPDTAPTMVITWSFAVNGTNPAHGYRARSSFNVDLGTVKA